MVVSITKTVEMSHNETQAFSVLERLEVKEKMKKNAYLMITAYAKLSYRKKLSKQEKLRLVQVYTDSNTQLQELKRSYKSIHTTDLKEEFRNRFLKIQEEMDSIKEMMEDLLFEIDGGHGKISKKKSFGAEGGALRKIKLKRTNKEFIHDVMHFKKQNTFGEDESD